MNRRRVTPARIQQPFSRGPNDRLPEHEPIYACNRPRHHSEPTTHHNNRRSTTTYTHPARSRLSNTKIEVTIDFRGCKVFNIIGAHSLGDPEGTILVRAVGRLCYLTKASKTVGEALTLEPVHVEVAGKLLTLLGTLIGKLVPVNKATKISELILKQNSNLQEFLRCEGGGLESLLTSEGTGPFEKSAFQTTDKFLTIANIELMA